MFQDNDVEIFTCNFFFILIHELSALFVQKIVYFRIESRNVSSNESTVSVNSEGLRFDDLLTMPCLGLVHWLP